MMASGAQPSGRMAAALLVGAALSGFDAGAVGYVLPVLRATTAVDAQGASWLVSAYVAAMLVGIPLAGAAVARFGALRLFQVCLVLAAAGALLALTASGLPAVLAGRSLQGLGQGPLLPLAATLVAQHWPAGQQGRLVGALSLAYGVAFLAATGVAPPLLEQWGWRAGFALSLLTAAAALAATWSAGGPSAVPPGAEGAGARRPGRAGARALMQREMVAIAVLSLGTGAGQAMLVWFPTLAIARLGVPALATSVLMLPLVVGGIAATLAITALLDRLGARRLLAIGAAAALVGVVLAVVAPPSRLAFMAGAGAFGLGIVGLCGGPLRYAAARAVPASDQGLAQSAVALLTNLGLLGGSLLLGALAGGSGNPGSEGAGITTALITTGMAMALSFVALAALRPHRPAATPAASAPSNRA
jgi:MFS family permease